MRRWADNRAPDSWATRLRQRRFALFRQLLETIPHKTVSILDVGGTPSFWLRMLEGDTPPWRITLLNRQLFDDIPAWMRVVRGDARALPFPDLAFDVVFSNSVIEHVGTWTDQKQMANEIRRVGRRYFVQTPDRYFPIEPHFLFPGFQFLPLTLRAVLLTRFNLGWYRRMPSYAAARAHCASIRLLSAADLRALFPGTQLERERVCGLVKSLMACSGWNEGHPSSAVGETRRSTTLR